VRILGVAFLLAFMNKKQNRQCFPDAFPERPRSALSEIVISRARLDAHTGSPA